MSKANRNSLYSVLVLVALGVSVVFVGYVLNLDAVRFSTSGDLKNSEERAAEIYHATTQTYHDDDYWKNHIDEYRTFLDRQSTALATYKTASDRATESFKRETDAQASMFSAAYRITSALITRASMIGVAIYLVILLNKSYKYNNGMASFYTARFLASLTTESESEIFGKRAIIFSPSIIYDDDIDHPLDKLRGLFEKLLERVGSGVVGSAYSSEAGRKRTTGRASEIVLPNSDPKIASS